MIRWTLLHAADDAGGGSGGKAGDVTEPEGSADAADAAEAKSGAQDTGDKKPAGGDLTDPTGEGKTDDGAEGGEGKPGKPAGAPEKYEAFKLPEGLELGEPELAKATELFKKTGLSQEQAQEFLDYHIALQQEQIDAHAQTVSDWREQLQSDPDIGGENLPQVLVRGNSVLKTFDDGSVMELLKDTGLGNHVGLTKMLNRIALAIGEDSLRSGSPSQADRSTLTQYERNKRDFPSSPELWGAESA